MNPGFALRRAMRDLVGTKQVVYELHPQPGYEDLKALYGSNARIASAAGYETGAQARSESLRESGKYKFTSAEKKKADAAYKAARKRRSSFLRNLERYENGETRPRQLQPLLERLARNEYEKQISVTRDNLLKQIKQYGITIEENAQFLLIVSQDERWRDRLPSVGFKLPELFFDLVERGKWDRAAEIFFNDCWGHAYGIGYVVVVEVEDLDLLIGMKSAQYKAEEAA